MVLQQRGRGCGALEDGREGLGQTLKRLHVYTVKGSSCYADGPSALELCQHIHPNPPPPLLTHVRSTAGLPRTRGNGMGLTRDWFKLGWEMALVEDIALVQMV